MTMKVPGSKVIGLAGLALVVLGFVYSVLLAGIPYQDPTAEMQANWNFHNRVGELLVLTGFGLMMVGAVLALYRRWR
jgi:hypothetical protein